MPSVCALRGKLVLMVVAACDMPRSAAFRAEHAAI
jgi:hypothetical protein